MTTKINMELTALKTLMKSSVCKFYAGLKESRHTKSPEGSN